MTSNTPILHLSQSNLQDYKDCPRRFQLKAIDKISWPAANLEPLSQLEKATNLGNKFHQLCQQYFLGISRETILESIIDPDLVEIFQNFEPFAAELKGENHFAEIILSSPFHGHQLIAKYDLLLRTNDGNYAIYDWKTASKKPSRTILRDRFQTFLYPFILTESGEGLFDSERPSPNYISMNYHYPLCSDPDEIFPYSSDLHTEYTNKLIKIVMGINNHIEKGGTFPLTSDHDQCQKCVYRSLCERGAKGGNIDLFTEIDQEDLSGEHFDLDNIIEIEF